MPRKKIILDWKRIEKMAMAGSNGVQIAAALGIHPETLSRRCKIDNKVDFVEYLRDKREKGNDLLLRKQYDIAMNGDKTMLIWLGKQRLQQREKVNNEIEIKQAEFDPSKLTEEEMSAYLLLARKHRYGGSE